MLRNEHQRYLKTQKRLAAAAAGKRYSNGGGGAAITTTNGSDRKDVATARYPGVLELKDERGGVVCTIEKSKDFFLNATQLIAEEGKSVLPLIPHDGISTKDPRPPGEMSKDSEKTIELVEVLLPRLVQETRAAKSEWDDDYNEIDDDTTDAVRREPPGAPEKSAARDSVSTLIMTLVLLPCPFAVEYEI